MNKKIAKDVITSIRKKKPGIKAEDYLSTGSTQLNLALSGNPRGGFVKGHYFFFVGDSNSGKTFLCLTCMAEACRNKHFDNHRLIFDDAEHGALMNFKKFFGKKMASRIEVRHSESLEQFYFDTKEDLRHEQPFIKVLDSMDALESLANEKKLRKQELAYRKGRFDQEAGSYGDGKAKINSQNLRAITSQLPKKGSILIIINQSRDNIGMDAKFNPKTRAGGRALKFYASAEMWTAPVTSLKTMVKGKPRKVGTVAKIEVKKNRLTGNDVKVKVGIHRKYGIDDVGSCIDYLVEEEHWKVFKKVIKAKELNLELKRDDLIRHIENEGMERELTDVVEAVWAAIEAGCEPNRKPRYE